MNTILTDDEIARQIQDNTGAVSPWSKPLAFHQFARAIEAAVLAKLREQEPVAWLVTGPYEKRAFTDLSFADASCRGLNKGFGEEAYTVTPLVPYAAPPTADWYCEAHPEHLMGHDGCTGGGIPECARVGQIANQLRLARQEIREIAQHRDDLVAQYRAALAQLDSLGGGE